METRGGDQRPWSYELSGVCSPVSGRAARALHAVPSLQPLLRVGLKDDGFVQLSEDDSTHISPCL